VLPSTFTFTDSEGNVNTQTLIIGNNGSGKSSILQAIVSLVAPVVRDNLLPDGIDWPGYDYRLLKSGSFPLSVEGEIEFCLAEIDATRRFVQELNQQGSYDRKLMLPGQKRIIPIHLHYDLNRIKPIRSSLNDLFQFKGYQYAKMLAPLTTDKSTLFSDVGNIYWYTENRTSTSINNLLDGKEPELNQIRTFLASAYNFHQAVISGKREIKEGEFDFYEKLHSVYQTVFPGRTFVGPTPRFDIYEKAPVQDFFLFDGHNQYEISGMSAGERAVFPILMDFARWNINNSIVIIDELELHLHPPIQQAFLKAIHKLGNNNQFIITSHSNHIAAMFDETENEIIRLPNE
jgi:predicted ATPase